MSDVTTIARPYAKAAFEYALEKKELAQWSDILMALAEAVMVPSAVQFITNPATTEEQQIEMLLTVCEKLKTKDPGISNFIRLLAENKRLMIIPEIMGLYALHKAEQEKTLDVDLISFSEVSTDQENKLIDLLSQKLQRKVTLNIKIDSNLLGGAVIRAGNLVIDGSVRGMLNKLSNELAA